jgi:fused signal recognition particle receptor
VSLVLIIVIVAIVVIALVGTIVATTRPRRGSRRPTAPERSSPTAERGAGAQATAVIEADAEAEAVLAAEAVLESPPPAPPAVRPALRERLGKARQLLGGYLDGVRSKAVDETTFDELEEALLLADAGIATTTRVLDDLRSKVRSGQVERSPDALLAELRSDLEAMFAGDDPTLAFGDGKGPTVWLLVGVNGVGKTTTIGKLAAREQAEGRRVVLAAGDTFRAAAGEQLETWAERANAGLIRGSEGADPSSVIFDAVAHAAARGSDLVIADTAGRLHTKVNLMEELRKVKRIAERPPGQLTEVILVLDATTGQNGLVQAKQFTDAVGITGVALTKLDGTAKGGVVLAIRSELGLPIKLVGVGEGVADLVDFDPTEFVEALFS